MSTTADQIEEDTLRRIDARLEELVAAKEEYERLTEFRTRVCGTRRAAPAPKPGHSKSGASPARAPGGSRQEEFLQLVTDNPGISITDAAARMSVAPNYLYRVRNKLRSDGKIRDENGGIYPVTKEDAEAEALAKREAELTAAAAKK